jgi:D-beta-D-heptose 7-phosphate kinase/D-beta-D-heptose 1-phosphate adenosyltransferase
MSEESLKKLSKQMGALQTLYSGQARIIWSNGCFDLFHAGHALGLSNLKNQLLRSLEFGKYLALPGNEDVELLLIVGVNNDKSVSWLKGPDRPVMPLADRMDIVQCIKGVDAVISFDGYDPGPEIEVVQPTWIAKDEDYRGKQVVGEEIAVKQGGGVIYIPRFVIK